VLRNREVKRISGLTFGLLIWVSGCGSASGLLGGSTEDREGPAPAAPGVREPWPVVPYTHPDRCEVIRIRGEEAAPDSDGYSTEVWAYDGSSGLLTIYHSGGDHSGEWLEYFRFDDTGRLVFRYGEPEQVRHDFTRDAHGNVIRIYRTHAGPGLDPTAEFAGAPNEREEYEQTYGDAGNLEFTFFGTTGELQAYESTTGLRCARRLLFSERSRIEEDERFGYDGDRLAERSLYDGNGKLVRRRVYEYTEHRLSAIVEGDGRVDRETRSEHFDDGSTWVEARNFTDDGAERLRWHFSAGCSGLALHLATSLVCEFENPILPLPLGWQ
jgi:hypothetical protein